MQKFPVETTAEIQPAKCSIEDIYVIAHKDARVIRRITYLNESNSLYPIELSAIPFTYFRKCENFIITANGEEVPFKESVSDFSKIITCEKDYELQPEGKLDILITCTWKNFTSFIDSLLLAIRYPDDAKYTLRIDDIYLEDKKYIILRDGLIAQVERDFHIDKKSIRLKEVSISSNKTHTVELLILSTPKKLDLLSYYVSETNQNNKFSKNIVIVIQHLLSDFVHLAEAFIYSGVPKAHLFIIGIPYSTKEETVNYLRRMNFPNIETPSEYPFDEVVKTQLDKAINLADTTGKKILVVEDGGYAVPLIHREFSSKAEHFRGAVEQTANGIWRDKEIKNEGKEYLFPIINVADSRIKAELESPLIGRAVCKNIEILLSKVFTDISGKNVGIVGFGRTGSKIAHELKMRGAKVKVYSDDKTDLARALSEGYIIAEDHKDLVKGSRIIIEATGQTWATREVILEFEHGTWFISASSKRMGIDYNEFLKLINQEQTVNIPEIGKRYEISNTGNSVTLIADGFPINFFNSESVPDKKIEFIPTLLFKCAEFLVNNNNELTKEIIEIDKNENLKKLSHDVATLYFDFHKK